MNAYRIPVQMLGQSGCRLSFPGANVYVDPYLSNSAQDLDSPDLQRQVQIPISPQTVTDADWLLITHAHIDHCDPFTIPDISRASPQARIVGPWPVLKKVLDWGVPPDRTILATERWTSLAPGVRVRAIPAAHPEIERDAEGNLTCVGYLIEYAGKLIYFAGDTFARQEIIDVLVENGPVHTAFLPVNEHNFFRAKRNIIGNMSVREAFQFAEEIGAKQVVAVHWDMFSVNAVDPEEIRLVYRRTAPRFTLLLRPATINLTDICVSIIIRTLNEATHLDDLLRAVAAQVTNGLTQEVILVDSGSTDGTLSIAMRQGCHIQNISREEFSFGRSLNLGCHAASGDILVITSGHCVPTDNHWLQRLCQPIIDGSAEYTYGRQVGGSDSHFSECRIFAKYYPETSLIPQEGFFCNNANSAVLRSVWESHRFDEDLTGLEDMDLAQRLLRTGGKVAYVADASVFHYHSETWLQVRRRFEREAIALQKIMPQVHVAPADALRYFTASVRKDWACAMKGKVWRAKALEIVLYRWNQYLGSYKGNHEHRMLSHADKDKYFYPH